MWLPDVLGLLALVVGFALTMAFSVAHAKELRLLARTFVSVIVGGLRAIPRVSDVMGWLRYRYRLATLDDVGANDTEFYLRSTYNALYKAHESGDLGRDERWFLRRRMDATAFRMAYLGLKPDPETSVAARMEEMGHWDRFYWRDT